MWTTAGQHSPVPHPGVRLACSFCVVLWQEASAPCPLGGPDGPALAGFLLLSGVHKNEVAGTECQLVHVLGLVLEPGLQGLEGGQSGFVSAARVCTGTPQQREASQVLPLAFWLLCDL